MIHWTVVGVDPGPIPGLCVIQYWRSADGVEYRFDRARALQCSANWIFDLVADALYAGLLEDHGAFPGSRAILTVERYVPRRSRGAQLAAGANQQTQEMAASLVGRYVGGTFGGRLRVVSYQPSSVMRWADEAKLKKAQLWDATTGCAHARAAAKHALYAACKDGGMPNPLSQRRVLFDADETPRPETSIEGDQLYVAPPGTPPPADPDNPEPPWQGTGHIRSTHFEEALRSAPRKPTRRLP